MAYLAALYKTLSPGGFMRQASEVGKPIHRVCATRCVISELGGGNLTPYINLIEKSAGVLCPVGPVHVSVYVMSWCIYMSIREIS